jgi:hypothetical protein
MVEGLNFSINIESHPVSESMVKKMFGGMTNMLVSTFMSCSSFPIAIAITTQTRAGDILLGPDKLSMF